MAEPTFAMHNDDDLPRTIRRERDARQQQQTRAAPGSAPYQPAGMPTAAQLAGDLPPGEGPSVTVTALDIPFFRLMAFFLKAVLAGIPALLLLGLILFGIGQAAQAFLPWLVKMKVLVTFG
jgi:hypothetical protein